MIVFTQAIVKIKVFKNSKCHRLGLVTRTKKRWFKTIETYQVIHRWLYDEDIPLNEFLEKYSSQYRIENDVVYYQPHYEITLVDGTTETVFFDTVEKLEEAVKELRALSPNIEI